MTPRRDRLAAQINTFVHQYASRHGRGKEEPNDRRYDRKVEKLVRHMDAQELDALLREEDEPSPEPQTVYVELLDEGVRVWRPVAAVPEGNGTYRLPSEMPADERWELAPGSLVRCELRTLEDGDCLVVVGGAVAE